MYVYVCTLFSINSSLFSKVKKLRNKKGVFPFIWIYSTYVIYLYGYIDYI